MDKKQGNLIYSLKENDDVQISGPCTIKVKKTKNSRVVVMFTASSGTDIKIKSNKSLKINGELKNDNGTKN